MNQEFFLEKLKQMLSIDSTTGLSEGMDEYFLAEAKARGFKTHRLIKGGLRVDLGGEGRGLLIAAHGDDIGLMVRRILPNGTLEVTNVGGMPPFQSIHENVRLYTRFNKVLTGTVRRRNPSLHLIDDEKRKQPMDYTENVCVTLDYPCNTKAEAEALGICVGDMIALEPRFTLTESGYIKSRFLDDKASCACALGIMEGVYTGEIKLNRHVYILFTEQEEMGHAGACGIPADAEDYLSVDIGCVGPDNASHEQKVTVTTRDAAFPYNVSFTRELAALCDKENIPYALDMMLPHYGSDANVAMRAGLDMRHGLIGPGVLETHGYERTHVDALTATYRLLKAVVEN